MAEYRITFDKVNFSEQVNDLLYYVDDTQTDPALVGRIHSIVDQVNFVALRVRTEFNVADQSLNITRFDTIYHYDDTNANVETSPASGADGIAFVDTSTVTFTVNDQAGSGTYENKVKFLFVKVFLIGSKLLYFIINKFKTLILVNYNQIHL